MMWKQSISNILLLSIALLLLQQKQQNNGSTCCAAMMEEDRLNEYHKRGYKWPLDEMIPNTPGWKRIMNKRFEQIQQIEDANDKYNGWMGFITAAIVTTNYTEFGWGVTRAPEHITKKLQDRLYKTLEVTKIEKRECSSSKDNEEEEGGDDNEKEGECIISEQEITQPLGDGTRKEHFINVIGGEDHARPIMITDGPENRDILNEMKPMFEWWSGKSLQGSIAYGIRAYRNDSNLLMHVDKSSTHVISGIFHVDRSDDAEPWPIVIEDFKGNTNQVFLEPGDILFYESSKCFHGRPQTFIGSYYASLFMHYRPVDFEHAKINDEIHYAIPQHWHETKPLKEGDDKLVVVGTSFKEPNCKHLLCSLDDTHEDSKHLVNWYGPAPKGKIVSADWDPKTMTPPRDWNEEYNGGKGAAYNVGEDEL